MEGWFSEHKGSRCAACCCACRCADPGRMRRRWQRFNSATSDSADSAASPSKAGSSRARDAICGRRQANQSEFAAFIKENKMLRKEKRLTTAQWEEVRDGDPRARPAAAGRWSSPAWIARRGRSADRNIFEDRQSGRGNEDPRDREGTIRSAGGRSPDDQRIRLQGFGQDGGAPAADRSVRAR